MNSKSILVFCGLRGLGLKPAQSNRLLASIMTVAAPKAEPRETQCHSTKLPPKPRSASSIYRDRTHTKLRQQYPHVSCSKGQLKAMALRQWTTLTSAERKPYELAEQSERARYDAQLRALGLQPQPLSSYVFYWKSVHRSVQAAHQHPSMGPNDLARLISKSWKSLTKSEKAPFVEMARLDQERFRNDDRRRIPPKDDLQKCDQNLHASTNGMYQQNLPEESKRTCCPPSTCALEDKVHITKNSDSRRRANVYSDAELKALRQKYNVPRRPGFKKFSSVNLSSKLNDSDSGAKHSTEALLKEKWRKLGEEDRWAFAGQMKVYQTDLMRWKDRMLRDGHPPIFIDQLLVRRSRRKVWDKLLEDYMNRL